MELNNLELKNTIRERYNVIHGVSHAPFGEVDNFVMDSGEKWEYDAINDRLQKWVANLDGTTTDVVISYELNMFNYTEDSGVTLELNATCGGRLMLLSTTEFNMKEPDSLKNAIDRLYRRAYAVAEGVKGD